MTSTSIHIASIFHDAARQSWNGVVEFFAPGLPRPLSVPVVLDGPLDVPHRRIVRAIVAEAQRRGIG